MTTEELLAQVPTLKPTGSGMIPEEGTTDGYYQPQAGGAVPVSYPSPRAVPNAPPSPQAQPIAYPSPRVIPPPSHAREPGSRPASPPLPAPSKAAKLSAKAAIKEAFKGTQGMFATTIRGARTKTTNLCVCVCGR